MNVGCKAKASSVVLLLLGGAKSRWIVPIGHSFGCRLYDGINNINMDWINPSYACARFCTLRGASLEMLNLRSLKKAQCSLLNERKIMVELGLA